MKKLKKILVILFIFVLILGIFALRSNFLKKNQTGDAGNKYQPSFLQEIQGNKNPLLISEERKKQYPGSDIVIEETLSPGSNYNQYVASYKSDGLKIYGLLTIPIGERPCPKDKQPLAEKCGWPVIIFNHGYIPPEQYKTTERYISYVDAFARNGYVVFKPDYRGHGNSEGKPEGAYYSPVYTTDVLNAISSIKKLKDPVNNKMLIINSSRIGMWGHSMGGNITLRVMVVSKDIKAGVIWGGVVGTYDELMTKWHRKVPFTPSEREIEGHVRDIRKNLVATYKTPAQNPTFWHSIDPRYYLIDISGPLQLHQGQADEEVPPLFSESLKKDLDSLGKKTDLFEYPDTDHNISQSFTLAMQRSLQFFDKYLK